MAHFPFIQHTRWHFETIRSNWSDSTSSDICAKTRRDWETSIFAYTSYSAIFSSFSIVCRSKRTRVKINRRTIFLFSKWNKSKDGKSHCYFLPIDLFRANVVIFFDFPRDFHRNIRVFCHCKNTVCVFTCTCFRVQMVLECSNTTPIVIRCEENIFGNAMNLCEFWCQRMKFVRKFLEKMWKFHVHIYLTSNHTHTPHSLARSLNLEPLWRSRCAFWFLILWFCFIRVYRLRARSWVSTPKKTRLLPTKQLDYQLFSRHQFVQMSSMRFTNWCAGTIVKLTL